MKISLFLVLSRCAVRTRGGAALVARMQNCCVLRGAFVILTILFPTSFFLIPAQAQQSPQSRLQNALPPRIAQARRFLAQRNWPVRSVVHAEPAARPVAALRPAAADTSAGSAAWQPLGPISVASLNFGSVSGRISSIAFDLADATGNRVYVGTTGGGVWISQNAGTSNPANVVFTPLTEMLGASSFSSDTSISIGSVSVQPDGTGVILAGTGDPNDALDSYYGGGILRSHDGGITWTVIGATQDQRWSFAGEGFAGFAWSTANPQLVVAAVSQSYEGTLVQAEQASTSYEGLYYSTDSGATWSLARITDGSTDVQGPNDAFSTPHGNAVTSVVWNPVRRLFIAAVRYHGYYQSTDGVTWMRMATQPGTRLTAAMCPANPGTMGSVACPIFRGTLAVNPVTGDTFAWSIDVDNQDQGLWQDPCSISGGACGNPSAAFSQNWNTSALETNTLQGAATIQNGAYTLALAAIPSGQDTLLMAGDSDLWKCSLATGCLWRNTTNTATCRSARVAPYQHAVAWNAANPVAILIGNDSGLWRSIDAIGESGSVCDPTDAAHFQNLNGSLGSLAEVDNLSASPATPYTLLTGLGANGISGVKNSSMAVSVWPQILDGEGGPVAIDPMDTTRWYANNQSGVAIHVCAQSSDCAAADFGITPVIGEPDVSNDGNTMAIPAAFLVDPLDHTQLLVATCRVWRGPSDGSAWTSANAISSFLDGISGKTSCNGDALIQTLAAMPVGGNSEVLYAGMYGHANGGANRAGHVYRAVFKPGSDTPIWTDLTFNSVTNDSVGFNAQTLDVTSIAIDPHDATGNTVYITIAGISSAGHAVATVYVSADGGAHWVSEVSNLPSSPANAVVVDPQDASTIYVATDAGVYSTRQIGTCATGIANCWSRFGTGLPPAPVTALSVVSAASAGNALVAGTYGRGVWMTSLWTTGIQLTTATVNPASLTFATQTYGTISNARTVTLTNTGNVTLQPTAVNITGDFTETDNCARTTINPGASCSIQVIFTPSQAGPSTGLLTISTNISGGALTVALSGAGTTAGTFALSPISLGFGQVLVGSTSPALSISVNNNGPSAVTVTSLTAQVPFQLASNACGNSIAASSSCQISVTFSPTQQGSATGSLTMVDSGGTQTVALTGSGGSAPTDELSPSSLTFPSIAVGQLSTAQTVMLTNSGDLPLNTISVQASGPFHATNGCGGSLASHSSCSISATFSPTQTGTQAGTLSVSDMLRTQTVALSGTGVAAAALSATPTQFSFAAQELAVASTPQILAVKNTGGSAASNIGFQIAGLSSSSFAVATTTCGASLAAGASCTAQINFTPAIAGNNSATLIISSSTVGVFAVQVSLNGNGQATNGVSVSPTQMRFTVAVLGQASAPQTATISNTGTLTASGLTLVVTAPFSLSQNSCGTSLAAGASCTVGVSFTPTMNGTVTGTLAVGTLTQNSAVAALTGVGGQAGSVTLQPTFLSFSGTGIGTASTAQPVTVTNTSSTITLSNLSIGVTSGFRLSDNNCGSSLAPAASCTASVVFAPSSAGQQSGALTVSSSQLATPMQAPLSGMGVDFTVVVSGSSNQTVASGQSALYLLNLTPLNGSSGSFTFSCGSLPSHTTCSLSPISLQVPANTTGSFSVTLATGKSQNAAFRTRPAPCHTAPPIAFGLVLLPLAWRRRRSLWLLLALLCVVTAGLSSCTAAGGGTNGTGGSRSSSTPPGTYTILITATANGLSRGTNLTLTVD